MSLGVRALALGDSLVLLDESLNQRGADVQNPGCKGVPLPSQCDSHRRLFAGRRPSDPLHVLYWKSCRPAGPAKYFLPLRKVLSALPPALPLRLCGRDSAIRVTPSRGSRRRLGC